MKHIEHNLRSIKRRIMVRVWYSYILSLVERMPFAHGLVLGGVVALFGRLTHVAALTDNLLRVPVSAVPSYVWQTITSALKGGEVATVLVTLLLITLSVGAGVRLRTILTTHHKEAMA
jgi:hypothetical protein